MELDDSFTEKLAERTKARREYLNSKMNEFEIVVGKKRAALIEEQQVTNQDAVAGSPDESPKRQCLEAPQNILFDNENEKENIHMEDSNKNILSVPFHASSKPRGLAALRKNDPKTSDIPDNLSISTKTSESQETEGCVTKPIKSLVQQFDTEKKEQNIHHSNTEKKEDSSDENEDMSEESNTDIDETGAVSNYENETGENISNSKSIADKCKNVYIKPKHELVQQPTVSKLDEVFYSNKDPAELPLSARKVLFERALIGGTSKQNESTSDHTLSVAQRAAMFENASRMKPVTSVVKTVPKRFIPKTSTNSSKKDSSIATKSPAKMITTAQLNSTKASFQTTAEVSPLKKAVAQTQSTISPNQNVGSHTRLLQQRLIENASSNWHEKDVIAKAKEQRKQEISSLVNHWEKMSSSSSTENNSPKVVPEHSTSFEKSDCLEENEEASESEQSEYEDNVEGSLQGKMSISDDDEVISGESVFHAHDSYVAQPKDQNSEEKENSITVDNAAIAVGQYWEHENSLEIDPHNRKSELSSTSISLKSCSSSSDGSYLTESKSQSCSSNNSESSYEVTSSEISEEISRKENGTNHDVPLLYTVSFYRKQKQGVRTPPLHTIVRQEKMLSPRSEDDEDRTHVIQERIKALQEEILRQQTVISQTSQALNLCSSTEEFSGSTEQVEGERLLLIATQKRQACLNEIQRLKTHGAQGENVLDGKGTLTISDLQLPLKREFMAAQLAGKADDAVHYFLCLIRHGPQVIVTHMVSTCDKVTDGTLCFTNHIKLQDLPADFSVVFEVYALQTKKQNLPHDKKYHIKREHSKIRLTPKGKRADGKFLVPDVSSPGGPNAVRSPSFGVIGFTRFSLQNCNKKCFTLDKVPFTSPLDGVLRVKLQLHAEHNVMERGFLTMFEDVSGFGAWHRRWCALDAHNLAYWKYPDEEQKKEPIGMIDLKQCVTGHVRLVSRDICARPHTFQLVTVRPQEKGDKNTLISRSVNTLTTTKHLLSADTKEERIMWCNKLNEALTNVRKWDPQALRPVESLQD